MVQKSKRSPFTEAFVKNLKPPAKGRSWHYDDKAAGLALMVTAAGRKSFYFYKWANGKPAQFKLGDWPAVSVSQARDLASEQLATIARGGNPQADRRQRREEPTLADLWQSYLELHAKPHKKSWRDDERMYNKYLTALHAKRLSEITEAVVAKWHNAIGQENGPVQANRCKALLATMFNKSAKRVGYAGPNPCEDVGYFAEHDRERFLLPAEMQAFFRALAAEEPYWQAFFLLCLFTGSRRGNVASMEWSELDLINSVWHIPASKTKNKRPTSIALCEPAAAILKTRYEQRNGQWVFPAFVGEGHLADPRKAWDRILTAMRSCPQCNEQVGQGEPVNPKAWRRADKKYRCPKCKVDLSDVPSPDLRMHDLRRTQGSWQAAMGISLAIIGKSLGHADLKSTQIYSRLQLDPVRLAVAGASASMIDAAHVTIDGAGVKLLPGPPPADPKRKIG
jgi:integrase